ncbi:nuclear transport factor 2 family protein [Micromonospora sp. NPDC004551]|uniref:nuclear transport factor 2 family protein n=1 Tax=Micromonospora sp. NPDC004551 TaxID=3154284 RepID=UPI00339E517B
MSTVTDRTEIAEMVARLAWALDERRFDDLRTVYAPDAETRSPRGALRGIDEIVDVVQRTSPEDVLTQHFNTDVVVDLDGDHAEVRAHQLVYFFRQGEVPHRLAGLQTRYTAVRTPTGWRLSRAEISPLWQRAS